MKYYLFATAILLITCLTIAQDSSQRLIYADFEALSKDKSPMSAREGHINFNVESQNSGNKPKIVPKMLGAQDKLTQRIGFEFEISKPNDWGAAFMKVNGFKDRGRASDEAKTLLVKAEDLSAYNYLTLEVGAAGATQMRADLISEGNGIDAGGATQRLDFTVDSQLKTYRLKISDFKQPTGDWVKRKYTVDQVIKKLTAVQINVTQTPSKGFVVFDNIAFEK
jgi:hypothetical protein